MTSARTCRSCGAQLAPHNRFCGQCGRDQTPAPTEAATAEAGGMWDGLFGRVAAAVSPRYRLVRLLGYGGMAGVYLAEEPRLGRRVAIKVMAPALMVDPSFVRRFEQEARTIAQLSHPNVVTVFDVDDRDDLHYFVMAYVPGRTLGHLRAGEKASLPIRAIEHIFAQAASALGYAHRAGVVHRDVKPGNILIDHHGNALVTDFGIAKVVDQPGLTQTGLLVGTPAYMSPEQCLLSPVTGASDQYSLAIVLYEMLTGAPPFTGPTVGVLHAHVYEPPKPVRELRPDCPPELAAALERMLSKSPEERFPSISEAPSAAGSIRLSDFDPLRAELGRLAAAVESVRIRGPSEVAAGESVRFEVDLEDSDGRPVTGRTVRWSVEPPELATTDEDGRVRPHGSGTVTVIAQCEGREAAAALTVLEGDSTVAVVAPRAELRPGEEMDAVPAPTPPTPAAPDPGPSGSGALGFRDRATWVVSPSAVPTPAPGGSGTGAPTPPAAATPRPAPAPPALHTPTPPTEVAAVVEASPAGPASPSAPRSAATLPERPLRQPLVTGGIGVAVIAAAAFALLGRGAERGAPAPDAGSAASAAATLPPDEGGGDEPGGSASVPEGVAGEGSSASPVGAGPDAATGPEAVAQGGPTPPTTGPDDGSPDGAAPEPTTGTFVLAGSRIPRSELTLSGPGGTVTLRGTEATLAPGSYTVTYRAPGYETATSEIRIREGQTETWVPSLRPSPNPPPDEPASRVAPVAPGPEAPAAEVASVIEAFLGALRTRDLDVVQARHPGAAGDWRSRWEPFYGDTRNVRDLALALVGTPSIEVTGDAARAAFAVRMTWLDFRNSEAQGRFAFTAGFTRGPDGAWTLTELSQAPG